MVLLDNIIFSIQKSGGISVVWGNIIGALSRNGVAFQCIEYPNKLSNIVRKTLNITNIEDRKTSFLKLERYINPNVLSNDNEPFVFHSSYYRSCNNQNAINITTVHDFTYEMFMGGLQAKVHKWQKNMSLKNSEVIVCISENTKRDVLRYVPEIDSRKLRVIYNGVSSDYKVVYSDSFSSLGEYVVFVGSRQPYKQFEFTVRAMKDCPFRLVIVGSPLSAKEDRFLIETLGAGRYIELGYLPNNMLNELYNQAVCLAYPSAYEGFGIPILEAQRAGCPVIAYNSSSIPEVIGRTPLLLNNLTESEFIRKLKILKSPSTRQAIIEAGLENSKRFSWEKMGNEYVELYKELLSKNR